MKARHSLRQRPSTMGAGASTFDETALATLNAAPATSIPTAIVLKTDHKGVALLMATSRWDKARRSLLLPSPPAPSSSFDALPVHDFVKTVALANGADFSALARRQDLEAVERDKQIAVFLKPDEAVALLRSNNRAIAALTYGWVTPDHPDETDEYLANVRRFKNHPLGAHIGGCFGIWLPAAATDRRREEDL